MSKAFLQKIFGYTKKPIPEPTTSARSQIRQTQETEEIEVTKSAEAAAEQQGSDNDPEQTKQPCAGWIAVRSRYMDFELISVSGRVTILQIKNNNETEIIQKEINYTAIANNNISEAQIASVAAGNGNPLILFGDNEGFEPGQYRITFRPEIRHGKLRIDPNPISTEPANDMIGRYKIIATDGTIPDGIATPWTTENTTDNYWQVPATTIVHEEWSQDITVSCGFRGQPTIAEFIWVDFRTFSERTDNNLRTLHPLARNRFFAFINKAEELDTTYTVTDAFRIPEQQDRLYCNNNTRPNKINYCAALGFSGNGAWKSNAKKWRSMHTYGLAIDMYHIEGRNLIAVTELTGNEIASQFGLEWGISFGDTPHFAWPSEGRWRPNNANYLQHVNTAESALLENSQSTYDDQEYLNDDNI